MLQAKLNDYTFHYVEKGIGDPVVFVHGSASDYRTWHRQQSEISRSYHTVAYSRRFHWPNEKIHDDEDYAMAQHVADLEAFLQFLGNKPVHLVGHSYGAFACLLLAAKRPALMRTLTLAEPPVITLYVSNAPKPGEMLKLFFSKPRAAVEVIKFAATGIIPATTALKRNDRDKALDIFGKATLGANTYARLPASRREQAYVNFIKAELLGSGFPLLDRKAINNIGLPTLLLSGQRSRKVFHLLLDELGKLLPHAERSMIPEASHIIHEDNPSGYNAVLSSFLEKY